MARLQDLIRSVAERAKEPAPPVKIRIPKSHPKADKLLELARKAASHTQLESGVVIERRADTMAVTAFIDCLRELVDVDRLVEEMQTSYNMPPEKTLAALHHPSVIPGLIEAAISGQDMPNEHIDPRTRQRYANIAEEMRRRNT